MSRPEFIPLPTEYRVRADVAAVIGGAVVFFVSGFLFASQSAPPRSLTILALIAFVTAIAAAIAASDNFDDAINHQELICRVRCGARTSGFGALVGAGSTVLGARVFGSQGLAIAAFIPSLLSILPSAFCGIIAAAIAAGIRVPPAPRREVPRKESHGGFTAFVVLFSAGAFSTALIPQHRSAAPTSFVTSQSSPSQMWTPPTALPSPPPIRTPYAESTVAATPFVTWTPTVFNTPAPTYPRSIVPSDPASAVIHAFLIEHHNKINRGDLNGLLNDYADQVVYFRKGVVNPAAIYREEQASRSKYRQYVEQIIYPLTISEMSPGHYHARYQIAFSAQKLNNRMTSGTAPVHMFVKDMGNGLRIVSQQNQIESGE